MSSTKFTAHHRKCLDNGRHGGPNGENEAQLRVGKKVLQECLHNGWLERLADSPAGNSMYRTIELGLAMLNAPVAKKTPARKPLKMLPPRLKTLR